MFYVFFQKPYIFSFYVYVCDPFHVNFCVKYEVGVEVYCFLYVYPVVPDLHIEKLTFQFQIILVPLSKIYWQCMDLFLCSLSSVHFISNSLSFYLPLNILQHTDWKAVHVPRSVLVGHSEVYLSLSYLHIRNLSLSPNCPLCFQKLSPFNPFSTLPAEW